MQQMKPQEVKNDKLADIFESMASKPVSKPTPFNPFETPKQPPSATQ